MVIRKHISIERKYEEKIKPFLIKHEGNFSAAIREIIDLALNRSIVLNHSDRVTLFDTSIANLLLKKTMDIIPEKEILYEIADPSLFKSVSKTVEYFNIKFNEMGWGIEFDLKSDSDTVPTSAMLSIKGEHYQLLSLSARIISLYLAVEKHIGIDNVYRQKTAIKLTYELRSSEDAAINDLYKYLGIMHDLFSEIEKKPEFWRAIVKKYQDSNYMTVAVHKNTFEELLAKKTPVGEIGAELIAKRPIKDIPHREFLQILKEMYESSRIAENVDIEGDSIKVFHSFRNPKAVNTLENILLNQLKANGHTYTSKSTRNLIILQHMPEIGIRISKLIENLNGSGSSFDKELIAFLSFMNGLKDAPDVSESIRVLGYMISKRIFREYEKEHDVHQWDLKAFQEAFSILDSKIGRVSEWKSVDESTICYMVKKCNLVLIGGEFNIDICQLARGFFKGAIEHAFRNDAEVNVIKQLTHGDDMCEVCICVNSSSS